MRIITGKYKGRHFQIPKSFSARPTTDFAKENLFNVLRAYVDWEDTPVLDLFGGTGSMSMEFLSRGCPAVVTVEMDRNHAAFISQCCRSLGDPAWTVVRGDALKYVARGRQRFPSFSPTLPTHLPNSPNSPSGWQSQRSGRKADSSSWNTEPPTVLTVTPGSWSIVPTAV